MALVVCGREVADELHVGFVKGDGARDLGQGHVLGQEAKLVNDTHRGGGHLKDAFEVVVSLRLPLNYRVVDMGVLEEKGEEEATDACSDYKNVKWRW